MGMSSLNMCELLEAAVFLFQIFGVAALCLNRLMPPSAVRWVARGRVGFVVAMIGLGTAGALCGRHDSEFSLFAGGTMTILLIGMTIGNGNCATAGPPLSRVAAEPNLAS
jgi:hypothetical protein